MKQVLLLCLLTLLLGPAAQAQAPDGARLQGAGYTYSWTFSDCSLVTVCSGSGPTFQTANVPGNDGQGTIMLTVTTGCSYSFTLPVVVGAPEEPVVELEGTPCYSTATFVITNYDPGLTYTVQHPGCSITGSVAQGNGRFALKGGLAATYTVTVTNYCGSASASGRVDYDPNCGSHYTVYPNPADGQLTVEQTDSTGTTGSQRHTSGTYAPANASASTATTGSMGSTGTPLFTVRVYNSFGTLQPQQTATTPAIDLQTGPLPTGLYAVTIEADGTIVDTRHVQITH